jgi:hypothetical protein
MVRLLRLFSSGAAAQALESLGPSDLFGKERYILLYLDARGKMMLKGTFVDMRQQIDNK